MKKHVNPYRIHDHTNLFEVGENSSHPEIQDSQRLWKFRAYTFKSATELEKFFKNEGLDPRRYWIAPRLEKDIGGRAKIIIEVTDRKTPNARRMAA